MTRYVTPDLEALVPGLVYDALKAKYTRLFTDRAAPADLAGRPIVIIQHAGGMSINLLVDHARLSVDVYAPTERMANGLAADVRGVLESLEYQHPILGVSTTGPVPITVANRGPQRQFYAELKVRKERA